MYFKTDLTIINSREELCEVVSKVQEFRGMMGFAGQGLYSELYRGQGRKEWKLESNIVRNIKDPAQLKEIEEAIVRKFHAELCTKGLESSILDGFMDFPYHNEWLWIQQAQHYTIPTRFMDWSANWETALLFAVSSPKHDDTDGQFWIYMVPPGGYVTDDMTSTYLNQNPFDFEASIFLNSAGFWSPDYLNQIGERRKFVQNGRFCIQSYEKSLIPLEEQPEHMPHISKIIIPAAAKPIIREQYAQNGLTVDKLFIEKNPVIEEIVERLKLEFGFN